MPPILQKIIRNIHQRLRALETREYSPTEGDADAIHDNVAGEIILIAEKVAPVNADVLVIEDSAAANAKKRVQMVNLPGGVDPNAIHVNVAAEIAGIAAKAVPVAADLIVIEDSAAANAKKSVQVGNLPGGVDPNAIHDNVAGEIAAIAAKAVPVNADLLVIEDSAAANAKKSIQIGNLPVPAVDFTLWNPDAPPVAPSALDDEFDDSIFDVILWTEFDPAADLTLAEVEEGLRFDQITDPGDDWSGIYQAIPGGNFTIIAKLALRTYPTDYSGFSLILWEDATNVAGDLYTFGLVGSAAAPLELTTQRWTDYQTWAATIAATTGYEHPNTYVRIRRDGVTYYFDYSMDGQGWISYNSGALTFVPTHFGIGINNNNMGNTIRGVANFFRYKNSDIGFTGSLEGDRIDGWRA